MGLSDLSPSTGIKGLAMSALVAPPHLLEVPVSMDRYCSHWTVSCRPHIALHHDSYTGESLWRFLNNNSCVQLQRLWIKWSGMCPGQWLFFQLCRGFSHAAKAKSHFSRPKKSYTAKIPMGRMLPDTDSTMESSGAGGGGRGVGREGGPVKLNRSCTPARPKKSDSPRVHTGRQQFSQPPGWLCYAARTGNHRCRPWVWPQPWREEEWVHDCSVGESEGKFSTYEATTIRVFFPDSDSASTICLSFPTARCYLPDDICAQALGVCSQ